MSDSYHLAPDRAPAAQLGLDLRIALDPPMPLGQLAPGDRFVLEDPVIEGKLVARGRGSATVAIRGEQDRWTKATWSLKTDVRRMRI